MIRYVTDEPISADEFVDILQRSTLAERRPVEDRDCVEGMLRHANLLVTAWKEDLLIGVARSVTDFNYCCYVSDIAVDQAFQKAGIGRELIRKTRERLGHRCGVILLSAPAATAYYPRIGFTRHDSAWVLNPGDPLE